jgi:hypothetical protein
MKPLQILVCLVVLHLGGCTAIMHDVVVNSFPDYATTMKNAPPLSANNGRIIIFYPRLPMAGFNPVPLTGPGGFGIVTVLVDMTEKTSVGDQTFVFIDLPAGSHTISHTRGGLLADTYDASIDLKAGETKFVQVVSEQFEKGPAKAISPAQAQQMLANMHHNFNQPFPFNQQPGGGVRAM